MTRSVDDRVMIRIREELASAALDRHTTSPLIFAFVHEKSKQKGFFPVPEPPSSISPNLGRSYR